MPPPPAAARPRLPITKTPKAYVGGAFVRSESGRVLPIHAAADGRLLGNVPRGTRKDLRNAVEAAGKALPGWARRTAYNRGQILYRLAEMVEARAAELAAVIDRPDAAAEVAAATDRLVHYAGWADKFTQVLGNTNPVAGPFFNFTLPEPVGVVGVLADGAFLGLVSQLAPVIVSGNVAVALAAEDAPLPALVFGEMLATSDLPGGVVNLLTGLRKELVPTFATHAGLRAVDAAGCSPEEIRTLAVGAAGSVKRLRTRAAGEIDWTSERAQGVEEIAAFVEFKTVWHPIGA